MDNETVTNFINDFRNKVNINNNSIKEFDIDSGYKFNNNKINHIYI